MQRPEDDGDGAGSEDAKAKIVWGNRDRAVLAAMTCGSEIPDRDRTPSPARRSSASSMAISELAPDIQGTAGTRATDLLGGARLTRLRFTG